MGSTVMILASSLGSLICMETFSDNLLLENRATIFAARKRSSALVFPSINAMGPV